MANKLMRNTNNGIIFGVCAGFAEYFNIDPMIIRLLTVFLSLFCWIVPVVYIILGIVLNDK